MVGYLLPALAEAGYRPRPFPARPWRSGSHDEIDWHSIAHYVDDVESIIAWAGGDVVLIGHSMGGFVAEDSWAGAMSRVSPWSARYPPQGPRRCPVPFDAGQRTVPRTQPHPRRKPYGYLRARSPLRRRSSQPCLQLAGTNAKSPIRPFWDMSMFSLPNLSRMARHRSLILGAEDLLVPPS